MLDDVIDVGRFPLPRQRAVARSTRRIGLGITGLADALVMLGLRYSSAEARQWAARTAALICHAAYRSSIALAREKGAFPAFDRDRYLEGRFVARLPPDIREGIATDGIRNSHLLAIAPTGSISLLAGCVSSGLEPIFAPSYRRTLTRPDGATSEFEITDQAVAHWRRLAPEGAKLPPAFECAADLGVEAQLDMQAALQPHVDSAISKTVTVAADTPVSSFARIFERAYDLGLKGCTAYRAGTVRGTILEARGPACQAVVC
jgi:ribonucleoside-diphosphate reductase alpha chain